MIVTCDGGSCENKQTCPADDNGIKHVFIGNPGVGKSTILNGLVGDAVFDSGPSLCEGRTKVMQKEVKGGDVFIDTPGFADFENKARAATEITRALQEAGMYKIFFVFTVEDLGDGVAVRAEDKMTMDLVLQSAPITEYGVIINKLDEHSIKNLNDNKDLAATKLLMSVTEGLGKCNPYKEGDKCASYNLHLIPRIEELESEENVKLPTSIDLWRFILRDVPAIRIDPDHVKEIEISDEEFTFQRDRFEEKLQQLRDDPKMLAKLVRDHSAYMTRALADSEKRHQEERKKLKKELEELQAQVNAMREDIINHEENMEMEDELEDEKGLNLKDEKGLIFTRIAILVKAIVPMITPATELLKVVLRAYAR